MRTEIGRPIEADAPPGPMGISREREQAENPVQQPNQEDVPGDRHEQAETDNACWPNPPGAVRELVRPGDVVLVKASRGVALEAVTAALVAAPASSQHADEAA